VTLHFVTAYTSTSALGEGLAAALAGLRSGRTGLRPCTMAGVSIPTWIGAVDGCETVRIDGALAPFDCRNNRLALLGLEQDGFAAAVARAVARHGAARVGVFMGTSTSGIRETELAYAARDPATDALPAGYDYRHTHNVFSVADFVRRRLGLRGPAHAISTACSSSAKVFAAAHRHMAAGLCDAVVVGGVDSLCLTTLYGFNSLQLVSAHPCRPWDARRDGINIGEAAGFALLERDTGGDHIALLGYGESSDAYHMSTPHPQGEGAALAMQRALARAGIEAGNVDYVNLHGTATPSNDRAEDAAMATVFSGRVPCSSTKGLTGHTLGAAGITEAVFACLAVEHGLLPGTVNCEQPDPALSANLLRETRTGAVRIAMTNSFGFGGSNCSLLFGRRA
jgi:3-oxoacyl-[acyl-carrier-protein] synthase-1